MPDIKWVDHHIEIAPPKRTKKLTATRFATVLGLNPWSTPFEIWCAVTKTWEKPFEDTIYTAAGKVCQPIQISYMKRNYAMSNLRTPTDLFGEDYFRTTYGDFFKDWQVIGGMWDSLLVDENGKPTTVLEFKTTKRIEDWADDVPEYYALQASLYAFMLGVDDVIMICSILREKDYKDPASFVPSVKNTITRSFKVSERYPHFSEMVNAARKWWDAYVVTGISPDYDEKKDAEALAALRMNSISPDTDVQQLLDQADDLKQQIDAAEEAIAEKAKRLDTLTKMLKEYMSSQFRDGDTQVELRSKTFQWVLSKTSRTGMDEDAMKRDGVWERYHTKVSESVRLTTKNY